MDALLSNGLEFCPRMLPPVLVRLGANIRIPNGWFFFLNSMMLESTVFYHLLDIPTFILGSFCSHNLEKAQDM